jgi:hypothetical protein
MAASLPLDRVTPLALDPGARVVVHGVVTTSVDGSSFDAAMQWDGLSPGASRPGGLFDLPAGGLRLVEQHPELHEYVLASTGDPGPGCAAAGMESPCLVPRMAALAHERLRTQGELASTLVGPVQMDGVVRPPVAPALVSAITVASILAFAALAIGLALAWLRHRARSVLGRVRAAGHDALRATRGDSSLDRVRSEVRAMLSRAHTLDQARIACTRRLSGIDRAALDRKRAAYARSSAPDAAETLRWLSAEQDEAQRLESDLSASVLGLQRIESALRVVTLRVREDRGTRARVARHDPVDAAASELLLRDEALREAESAVSLGDR